MRQWVCFKDDAIHFYHWLVNYIFLKVCNRSSCHTIQFIKPSLLNGSSFGVRVKGVAGGCPSVGIGMVRLYFRHISLLVLIESFKRRDGLNSELILGDRCKRRWRVGYGEGSRLIAIVIDYHPFYLYALYKPNNFNHKLLIFK